MSRTLYLIQTRARYDYECAGCHQSIARGTPHFRHDPYPYSRMYRGHKTTHWCRDCILASAPGPKDAITGRIRVPALAVISLVVSENNRPLLEPVRVELIGIGRVLSEQLSTDLHLIHSLTPEQFEELICDRFFVMRVLEPMRNWSHKSERWRDRYPVLASTKCAISALGSCPT